MTRYWATCRKETETRALCDLGEKITPNAHALTRQFTLFDNAYVSGTNSADGHAWSTQALCNDYMEHFYNGYRTYPDDGDCAMSRSSAGNLWDAAAAAHVSYRDYGEYCDEDLASFMPKPKNWMDVWKDRVNGTHRHPRSACRHAGACSERPIFSRRSSTGPCFRAIRLAPICSSSMNTGSSAVKIKSPQLMVMALPCDHTEGRNPDYPKPQ